MNMKKTALILAAMMTLLSTSCKNNAPAQNAAGAPDAPAAEAAAPTTNGKDVVTRDTMFVEGVKAGMTVDEVKSAIGGEPGMDMEVEGMHILNYGSDEEGSSFIFESKPELFSDDNMRLTMASLQDDSVKWGLGLKKGCSKDDVINAFCCDLEDHTPDEIKADNERILYGIDGFNELDELDKAGKLSEAKGDYRFGMLVEGDTKGIIYADMSLQDKTSTYFVMYMFNEEGNVDNIMMMYSDVNLLDELMPSDSQGE